MTCYGVHIIFYCLKNKQRWFSRLYTSIMATEIGILLGIMISAMQKVNLQWQMINLTLTCKEKCTFFVLMSMPVSNWWQDIWHYFIIARGSYVLLFKKRAYSRYLSNAFSEQSKKIDYSILDILYYLRQSDDVLKTSFDYLWL